MDYAQQLKAWFPELDQLKDTSLTERIGVIWQEIYEKSAWSTPEQALFSMYSGGLSLWEHTKCVLSTALHLAGLYENNHGFGSLDKDILITACVLHDVDKMLAYAPDGKGSCVPTDIGLNYQHGFYSAFYAEKFGLPTTVVTMLIDHTSYSRMAPDSPEGMILVLADLADAEMINHAFNRPSEVLGALGKINLRQRIAHRKET